MLIAAALLAAAAPVFAPPVDQRFSYITSQTRTVGQTRRTVTLERTLVFRRTDAGLVAEVTLTRVDQNMPGELGRRAALGAGALKGRTLRFHLADDGHVTGIDDEDAVWAANVAGVSAMALPAKTPGGGALAHDPAAPLRALSPERRLAVLASIIEPVTTRAPRADMAVHPVRIGSHTLSGAPAMLEGIEETHCEPARCITTLHAGGQANGTTLTLTRSHDVDPATGLTLTSEERLSTALGDAVQLAVTTIDVRQVR